MLADILQPVCNLQVRTGWQTYERPGIFNPIGIIVHHTAGTNDLNTVIAGRPDLPGPLSNLYSDRDSPYRITLISGGRCNHAGPGAQKVLDEVRKDIAPSGDAAARGLIDGPSGNGFFYGIECENLGNGSQTWPTQQLDAVAACCAAICKQHGWTANRVIGHREWTRRKPDPRGFSMVGFRAMVGRLLTPPQTIPQEDDELTFIIWRETGQDVLTGAVTNGVEKVILSDGKTVAAFRALGMKEARIPAADWDAIPTKNT